MNIVNDKITEYLDGLYRPLSSGLEKLRRESEKNNIPIILKDTETMLMAFVMSLSPVNILEIGTAVGYSAACFASVCPKASVTTIEARDTSCEKARENLKDLGLDNRVKVIHGDAEEVLRRMREKAEEHENRPFDFVFIDAAKSHYREYWDHIMELITDDAVIVSDNVLLKGITASEEYLTTRRDRTSMMRMREYLDYITGLADVYTSVLPVGDGLALSVPKGDRKI